MRVVNLPSFFEDLQEKQEEMALQEAQEEMAGTEGMVHRESEVFNFRCS
jgi:hypothetical protein